MRGFILWKWHLFYVTFYFYFFLPLFAQSRFAEHGRSIFFAIYFLLKDAPLLLFESSLWPLLRIINTQSTIFPVILACSLSDKNRNAIHLSLKTTVWQTIHSISKAFWQRTKQVCSALLFWFTQAVVWSIQITMSVNVITQLKAPVISFLMYGVI